MSYVRYHVQKTVVYELHQVSRTEDGFYELRQVSRKEDKTVVYELRQV